MTCPPTAVHQPALQPGSTVSTCQAAIMLLAVITLRVAVGPQRLRTLRFLCRTWWPAHVHQPCGQRLSDHHVVGWRAAHVVHSNAVAGVAADGHAEACRRFGDGDVREQSRLRQQQMTSSNQEVNITMCKTVPGKDSTLRCEFKLRCCVLSSLHYGAAKQQK